MGRLDKGILGGVKGKIGPIVGYNLNGQDIIREIGRNDKPLSIKQLNNNEQMKVLMNFLSKMDVLLQTGFNPKAKGTTKNFHNLAISANKPHAMKGFYPDVEIDYTKIVISEGSLLMAVNPTVELTAEGLKFNWSTEGFSWPENTDRVMLLAYAPGSNEKVFKNSGAKRLEGTDTLELTPPMQNELLETYISFVSDDRLRVANSTYIGSIVG